MYQRDRDMAERPYSFLKGSEAAGVGLLRPLPAGGTAPAVLRCPPALGAPPWTPQMCQGRGGTRGPSLAAGPQPGPPPSPALGGGDFAFVSSLFCWGGISVHLGLSGRFGEIIYIFFFLLLLLFYFQEDNSLCGAGRGAQAGYALSWRLWLPPCFASPTAGRGRWWDRDGREDALAEVEAQLPARPRGRLGKGAGQRAFLFIYFIFAIFPLTSDTHTQTTERFSVTTRALFMDAESVAIWVSASEKLCGEKGRIAAGLWLF